MTRKNGKKTDGRNLDGTFATGNSGRPKGSVNKTTKAVLELLKGDAEAITAKAVSLALEGDSTALRLCIERICPAQKDKPVQFELPSIENSKQASDLAGSVVQAMAVGELTPVEASGVMAVIDSYRRILETTEIEARLEAIENGTRA